LLLAACTGKTSSAGSGGSPSLATSTTNAGPSPGIERIAFESDRDGNFEIYTMNVDGTGLTRLTHNPARDHLAAWSPDGRKIAFASDRSGGGDIYVMEADGTGVTRLTTSPGIDANAEWSPDGAYIAFNSSRGGDSDIYVMKSDGSDQQRVTKSLGDDVYPAWGPNNEIAWCTNASGDYDVAFNILTPGLYLDGPAYFELVASRANDCAPNWSRDGRKLVFMSDFDGKYNYNIFVQGPGKRQKVRRVTDDPGLDTYPAWSPKGDKIAFTSQGDGNADIYVMSPDGSDVIRLTHSTAKDGLPAWSP
jgi:Tol biopolymer transport system component